VAPAYTFALAEFYLGKDNTQNLPLVPAGRRYVIRNVQTWFLTPASLYLFHTETGNVLLALHASTAPAALYYEGRVVLDTGQAYYLQASDNSVFGSITAYDLSTT